MKVKKIFIPVSEIDAPIVFDRYEYRGIAVSERQGVIVFTPEELKTVIVDFGMRLSVRYKWVADKKHTMYFTGIANNNEQSIEEISDEFLKERGLS